MKRFLPLIMAVWSSCVTIWAKPLMGVDSVESSFFREWYLSGELVHYLDNMTDYVTYEAETTGEWYLPEQKVFSIRGNSYKWNKYYYQDFRIDSRFQEGGTIFQMDMYEQSLRLDYERGRLYFQPGWYNGIRKNRKSHRQGPDVRGHGGHPQCIRTSARPYR